MIWKGGDKKPSNPKCYPCNLLGLCIGPYLDLGIFQAIIYISSEHNVSKNNKNKLFSTVFSWFDLDVTLRWPYHDLWITPIWNPAPTHVTMCTWVGFRPIYWKYWSNNLFFSIFLNKTHFHWQCVYDRFSYHPRGQEYHTLMTPGDLIHV